MRRIGRHDPEAPENLAKVIPNRTYTAEEVTALMDQLFGMLNDGMSISGWSMKEAQRWFEVEVIYEDGRHQDWVNYETWYFFKAV